MNKQQDKILITGATGQQGGATAHQLLAKGYKVRAMTRKPNDEKAKALAQLGAEIVAGDLNDSASLEKALSGIWGTFAVQNTWEAGVQLEEEQGKRFATLAKKAGIKHFVYTSVGSAHRNTGIPHFDNKWRVEETVRSLGFPSYTIIRPVFFMDNFLSPWFKPMIDQGKLAMRIKPATRLQSIAVEDIGRYGMIAFERHEHLNGRAIDLAGDEKTMPETAENLSKAMGKKIVFEQTPIAEVRKFSEDYALMLEWFDKVGYNADIKALIREFDFRPMSLTDWASKVKWS